MAAFAPDGATLAVEGDGGLTVIDRDGRLIRRLDSGPAALTSGVAWSPDGRLLVVADTDPGYHHALSFVDASGAGGAVPGRIDTGGPAAMVAWAGDRLLIRGDAEVAHNAVVEVDLTTGGRRVLTEVDTGPFHNYGLGPFQLATGLLDRVEVREAAGVSRGPWPRGLRVALGGPVVLTLAFWIRRRLTRHR